MFVASQKEVEAAAPPEPPLGSTMRALRLAITSISFDFLGLLAVDRFDSGLGSIFSGGGFYEFMNITYCRISVNCDITVIIYY